MFFSLIFIILQLVAENDSTEDLLLSSSEFFSGRINLKIAK